MTQHIPASPVELQKLAQRIAEAEQAERAAKLAASIATDVFTMFCEGHGVSGATFVGIEEGAVVVRLPDQPAVPDLALAG